MLIARVIEPYHGNKNASPFRTDIFFFHRLAADPAAPVRDASATARWRTAWSSSDRPQGLSKSPVPPRHWQLTWHRGMAQGWQPRVVPRPHGLEPSCHGIGSRPGRPKPIIHQYLAWISFTGAIHKDFMDRESGHHSPGPHRLPRRSGTVRLMMGCNLGGIFTRP